MGVLTRHLVEPNTYASWTLLLGLWAPALIYLPSFTHPHTLTLTHSPDILALTLTHPVLILTLASYILSHSPHTLSFTLSPSRNHAHTHPHTLTLLSPHSQPHTHAKLSGMGSPPRSGYFSSVVHVMVFMPASSTHVVTKKEPPWWLLKSVICLA